MTEPPDDVRDDVKDALRYLQVPWDEERTERCVARASARRKARRRERWEEALLPVGAVACLAMVVWAIWGLPEYSRARFRELYDPFPDRAPSQREVQRQLQLEDGSRMVGLSQDARFELLQGSAERVEVAQTAGAVRYSVTPGRSRTFSVRAGGVRVTVLGTQFDVYRLGEHTKVSVQRGRVAVSWPGGSAELLAGSTGQFPPPASEPEANESPDAIGNDAQPAIPVDEPPQLTLQQPRSAKRPAPAKDAVEAPLTWREQAQRGDFQRAYDSLNTGRPPSSISELLLAADAARLSGHPEGAVGFLRQAMRDYPGDARAPLAAFTLGNVYLNQLGLPREAEAAYEKARKGTRSKALAQDALARQVEAAYRSGDEALARQLAQRYEEAYPKGRRLQAVRRFGGLR